MADKFQNKYRVPSARWKTWNYSWDGNYFITICTANRECLFGRIVNNEMILSEIGQIVLEEWEKSFEIRQELYCDAFTIMPNHIHAIISIENKMNSVEEMSEKTEIHGIAVDVNDETVETHGNLVETHVNLEETHGRASLRGKQKGNGKIGIAYREPKSISSFAAGFKSAVTSRINKSGQTKGKPVWQERFHDHIIRDEDEFRRIVYYIETNVEKWMDDMFYNK
jgi:REP element-mobilizing transposase RayT